MSYCNTKDKEKARMNAIKEVLLDKRSISQVARRYGCHRSTVYRWLKRYYSLKDEHEISLHNGRIPTISSRPKTSPTSLPKWLVEAIIELRKELNRCAEIIWQEALRRGLRVSLSSVRRIIKRYNLIREISKWKRYRKFSKRPKADYPGALVEIDTVHFYHPITKQRVYATSVIDVYSRMAYVYLHDSMQQIESVKAVLKARAYMGFHYETIQSDNGPEFGKKFQDEIIRRNMKYRHIRVRRPNDNAHIERFNRTLREECLGNYISDKETFTETIARLSSWLDYYNRDRLHLGLECATPFKKCCKGLELN